jgi:hypothetical protein
MYVTREETVWPIVLNCLSLCILTCLDEDISAAAFNRICFVVIGMASPLADSATRAAIGAAAIITSRAKDTILLPQPTKSRLAHGNWDVQYNNKGQTPKDTKGSKATRPEPLCVSIPHVINSFSGPTFVVVEELRLLPTTTPLKTPKPLVIIVRHQVIMVEVRNLLIAFTIALNNFCNNHRVHDNKGDHVVQKDGSDNDAC